MRKMRPLVVVIILLIVLVSKAYTVQADTGPKPTLEILVENFDDSKYYLDLLGKEGEYGYFGATDGNKEYDHLHDQPIYKYNIDGWKAIHMRTWVLSGKLTGEPLKTDNNGKIIGMKHSFGYAGVPKEFKIIIQKADGSLQVSDVIHNNHFNAVVHYDMKQNKVLSISGNILKKDIEINSKLLQDYFLRIVITLLIEIFIAIPFFYKHLRRIPVIAIVNFITQTLLTAGMLFDYPILHTFPFNTGYFAVLMIGEIIVFLVEYLLYLKFFGKYEKRKIIAYTVIANLGSFIAGFLIQKIVITYEEHLTEKQKLKNMIGKKDVEHIVSFATLVNAIKMVYLIDDEQEAKDLVGYLNEFFAELIDAIPELSNYIIKLISYKLKGLIKVGGLYFM